MPCHVPHRRGLFAFLPCARSWACGCPCVIAFRLGSCFHEPSKVWSPKCLSVEGSKESGGFRPNLPLQKFFSIRFTHRRTVTVFEHRLSWPQSNDDANAAKKKELEADIPVVPAEMKQMAVRGFIATNPGKTRISAWLPKNHPTKTRLPAMANSQRSKRETDRSARTSARSACAVTAPMGDLPWTKLPSMAAAASVPI